MQNKPTLIKNKVNLAQIKQIKAFTELGATKKLFEIFWAGQYIRVVENALEEYSHGLPFEKSTKIGATSWLSGRHFENVAYLVYSIYKAISPENKTLCRSISPEELSRVTLIYNIKYHNISPLIITKVYSLLNGLAKNKMDSCSTFSRKMEGISFHECRCGNVFIARCSTVTATCQWCRSKIKKSHINRGQKLIPKPIDINAIANMNPCCK